MSTLAQNPPEEVGMRGKDDVVAKQWQLPFRDDEIWTALPERTRTACRALFEELLKATLKQQNRRENERQD
jgi:hypothetical protein